MHRVIIALSIVLFVLIILFLIYQQSKIQQVRTGQTPGPIQPSPSSQVCVPAARYSPQKIAAHTQQTHSGTPRAGNI
jgi:hypothetical protein